MLSVVSLLPGSGLSHPYFGSYYFTYTFFTGYQLSVYNQKHSVKLSLTPKAGDQTPFNKKPFTGGGEVF